MKAPKILRGKNEAMIFYAQTGQVAKLATTLQHGANINHNQGHVMLMAIFHNSHKMFKLGLKFGIKVNLDGIEAFCQQLGRTHMLEDLNEYRRINNL